MLVRRRAEELGLKVRDADISEYRGGRDKHLIIEERICQLVRTREIITNNDYRDSPAYFLYLPRNEWPAFMIHVMYSESRVEPPVFYIVPSGDMKKDTCLTVDRLASYKEAWNLLRDIPAGERTTLQHRELSSPIQAVIDVAKMIGLSAHPVQRPDPYRRGTPFYQDRVVIEHVSCKVMSAPRTSNSVAGPGWNAVHLRVPKRRWGDFIIYVITPPDGALRDVLIMPWGTMEKNTSGSLITGWLEPYKNAWELLSNTEVVKSLTRQGS